MIRSLRQMFRPDGKNRRLMSGLCGVLILCSLLFSSLFVIVEADHDCGGESCPVCLQIQACLEGARQTGPLPWADVAWEPGRTAFQEPICAPVYRAPATTLQSLYVRMDE